MAQGVGQSLLHDPVRRHVHGLRHLGHRPGHLHGDGGAGAANLGDQLVELGQRRERRQCGGLALTDETDDPAQLVDRLPAERLRSAQGLLLHRADAEPAAYDPDLERHHADRVRHGVVQLAGDPGALGGDGDLGLLLALVPQLLGQRGELRRTTLLAAQQHPDHPGGREDQAVEQELPDRLARHHDRDGGHDGGDAVADQAALAREPVRRVADQQHPHDQLGPAGRAAGRARTASARRPPRRAARSRPAGSSARPARPAPVSSAELTLSGVNSASGPPYPASNSAAAAITAAAMT